jgi:hypothetical protein
LIDNRSLLENFHEFKLKEGVVYGENYIILPKWSFLALSRWYSCNKILKRGFIKQEIKQQFDQKNKNKNL